MSGAVAQLAQMGGRIPVTLEVKGDELVITLTVPGNPPQPLTFRRGGVGSAPPETASNESDSGGERDARLVGSWSRTDTLSSGDTSLSTKMYLQIQGNGTLSMTTDRSAGGGPGWGAGSGGGETVSGRWQTRGGIVYVSDGGPFNAYAKYYIEANKLMFTFGNGSREIWYR